MLLIKQENDMGAIGNLCKNSFGAEVGTKTQMNQIQERIGRRM